MFIMEFFLSQTLLFGLVVFFVTAGVVSSQSQASTDLAYLECNKTGSDNDNNIIRIPPEQMTPRYIKMGFLIAVTNNGEGMHYRGAFHVALEDLREKATKEKIPVTFDYDFRDTRNHETHAVQEMANLYCENNITAYIGPSGHCWAAALIATAYNLPYITYDCQEQHIRNATAYYSYFSINAQALVSYIPRFMVAVMQSMGWKSFWIVKGTEVRWDTTAARLSEIAGKKNITVNGITANMFCDKFVPKGQNKQPFKTTLLESKDRTRVYVFLGVYESLVVFLRDMHALGMTDSGLYPVVAGDDPKQMQHDFHLLYIERKKRKRGELSPEEIRHKLDAFRNVILLQQNEKLSKHGAEEFDKQVRIKNGQRLPPSWLPQTKVPHQAYQLYDATMFYGRAVMELMARGADPEDAKQIIDHIRCSEQESLQTGLTFINRDGESEGNYITQGVKLVNGEPYSDNGTFVLEQTGTFTTSTSDSHVTYMPGTAKLWWTNGKVPVSNPKCGFDGLLCPVDKVEDWKLALIGSAVIVFVVIIFVLLFVSIRHWRYEQKLERLAWKIEREEIQLMNPGQFKEMMTPARPRKKDSYTHNPFRELLLPKDQDDLISENSYDSGMTIPVGVYRGTNIVVKQLTRRHTELTRSVKKLLQLRKELTHENLNRFIGACFEPPQVYIVTQYCPRKSLQDILQNDDSPLDDMFITSLVQDLIRGMAFIHESEFVYHGNLKSSNCLVDSRWTLKITDFGLQALGPPPRTMVEDDKFFKSLLWTAPELLTYRRYPGSATQHHHHLPHYPIYTKKKYNQACGGGRGSGNQEQHVYGSQSGDVYSFAIILYELYGRAGPWGDTNLSCRDIIEKLTSQASGPLTERAFRPDTTDLENKSNLKLNLELIKSCWDHNPDLRPDFKYTIRARFKPLQQGFLKSNIFDNMLAMMEKYANSLEVVVTERTEQLRQEKKLTENLLLRMLPRSVAEKLKRGQRVEPEQYEQVSIYFSDIVGFTELSAESTPMEVVDLLNDLYTCFDSIIEGFDVYKVETIGDAYMVVSGLPIRNGDRHAGEIASMSLLLLAAIRERRFRIHGSMENMLKIRIGIHSGPCCAGVVGLKMPRYCLFGDTVNTASRLESSGEALKIHCSAECKKILDKLGGYHLRERGYTEMKGKGKLLTYFLMSEDQNHRCTRINRYQSMGHDNRCVSASNLDYSGKIYSLGKKSNPHIQQLAITSRGHPTSNFNTDNRISGGSVNTSMDSTWSEIPGSQSQQRLEFPSCEPRASSTSLTIPISSGDTSSTTFVGNDSDFSWSTLPRASLPKHRNSSMSPIAEDNHGENPLEKTLSVPTSPLPSDNLSENDSLLRGSSLNSKTHHNNNNNQNRRHNSWTPLSTIKKNSVHNGTASSDLGDEMDSLMDCNVDFDSSSPETVL